MAKSWMSWVSVLIGLRRVVEFLGELRHASGLSSVLSYPGATRRGGFGVLLLELIGDVAAWQWQEAPSSPGLEQVCFTVEFFWRADCASSISA